LRKYVPNQVLKHFKKMMLSTKYQELPSIGFQRFMFLLGFLLGIFSIVYSNFVNQRWSYIEEIPSQRWNTSQGGNYTFLCAFGMLHSNAPVQMIGEESNICTKNLGDKFLPEYAQYIKKIYFQDNTRAVSLYHIHYNFKIKRRRKTVYFVIILQIVLKICYCKML
jgi:predicted cation transporter